MNKTNKIEMKKLLIIILSLIVIGVISYVIFIAIGSDPDVRKASGTKSVPSAVSIGQIEGVSEWREEDRTGVSGETKLLKSWPEEGPELIWTNTELHKGHSSVSFGNNTIYLTGLSGLNDVLIALDDQGRIKWQTVYGRCWKESNPESRCTPTVEGKMVYVSSGSGDLACIDGITGEIVWSVKASEMHKGTYGPWGIAESPIIDGQKLYYTPGGPETMTIALDKTTGDLIWKSESLDDGAAYVSPVLIEYEGRKMIINVSLKHVFAVDASTGHIIWKLRHAEINDPEKSTSGSTDPPLIKCVTPLYSDGKIYITGGYNNGAALLSLTDGGNNAKVEWTDDVLDVHHGGVVMIDGYIYGANWLSNGKGNWCCVDWKTGKTMWEENWKNKGSIIAADGHLYIIEEKTGFLGLLKINPSKFEMISNFKIKYGSGAYWAHPVIHNGVLYIRHGEALMAFDIREE